MKQFYYQKPHGHFIHVAKRRVKPRRRPPWRRTGPIPNEPPWDKGKPARVYLKTHEKRIADAMVKALEAPIEYGDATECRRRRDLLQGRTVEQIRTTAFHWGLDDNDEYLEDWLKDNHPEFLKEWDEAHDDARKHLDAMMNNLATLDQEERYDLINEHAISIIEWVSDDTELLETLLEQIETHLGINECEVRPSKQKLSTCSEKVRELKLNSVEDKTLNTLLSYWQLFIDVIGDLPVNHLQKSHFIAFEQKLIGNTGGTFNAKVKAIGQVLRLITRKTDWEVPSEWQRWFECIDRKPHKTQKVHRKRTMPDTFDALLDKAEEWSRINVQAEIEKVHSTPTVGRLENMERQNAINKVRKNHRDGLQCSALFRLACNCGCDNKDIERLTLDDLQLTSEPPVFTLPRLKPKTNTGAGVERSTPLLPSTVKALEAWIRYAKPTDHVFSNINDAVLKSDKVGAAFKRIKIAAGLSGTNWYKQLRNIGATLATTHHLSKTMIDLFMGHSEDMSDMNVPYTDDMPTDFVAPIVNLIGAEYFDDETVGR